MAEENTQPLGAANHGSEPTTPVPLQTPADQAPIEAAWIPRPDAYAAAQPFTTSGPAAANQPAPAGASYAPPNYGPPSYGPPSCPPPAPPGAGYYGQPQHPSRYATGGYSPSAPTQPSYQINDHYASYYGSAPYSAPPTPPKRRWPLVVVAGLLALALGLSGYVFAGGQLGAAPEPTVTQPVRPSNGPSTEPTTNTGTQSKTVTATEAKGVALIEAETSGGTAYGTGMVLTADGKVLTNYHVVAGTTKVAVTIATSGDTYAATVLGFDQTRDVALLQLKSASGLETVTVDNDPAAIGDEVSAVGNANGGMKLVKADGEITGTNQDLTVNSDSPWGNTEDLSGLVATNAGAVPGDSGGPMFDAEDEVLGMTTAGSTSDHASYAVPISDALAVVQQIETGQDAGTVRVGPAGFIGVQLADNTYTGVRGSTLAGVVAGSPAEKAGLTKGCRLTKVGGVTITEATNVAAAIRAVEPGQQVTIWWVTASGKSKHATVTAGASQVN
ncbi:trypsin-like peptidase domain-containing protein [Propionicimonas sp.]|uniref:S1C family serine protease n=1 Tax=Propionicimonas sp. TaxID=1955623 RepID=UPI0017D7802E|nr:trypsin-like peptidase domain-containing protein [Propionicimonas sp.]MBU3975534.1 S1C family serine protease [Actinomycetota bacterium]MBA3020061.1 trypsin-like serine protease [Propionicimonas sp.]MBU3986317.1 S1C family serine protease [Actinomycetota bacterium]MBU4007886.1 S1C family serine protease [Actinomycetota bacterium]MBU4064144.1 S1C family serine protease [Actinomycetota bacterium]